MTYQLFVGNNLEILPTLPDNSIDSIVTDPPYGLSDNKYVAETIARWIAGERDFVPDGKGFMGKSWDAFVPPPALWDECLRVLKPGGHLLAFFGSRTQDIGALAIRLAGFEIRDSIAWLYGSGFPKSMDVSKAIDKNNGKPQPTPEFKQFLRAGKAKANLTSDQIDKALGFTSAVFSPHYVGNNPQIEYPTKEKYKTLKKLLNLDDSFDYLIDWAEAKREVIGQKNGTKSVDGSGHGIVPGGITQAVELDITAPTTPEAQQWQGWGTALKPALEPIVVARKPIEGTVANNVLKWGTGGLNIDGSRIGTRDKDESGWAKTGSKASDNVALGKQYDREPISEVGLGRWPANIILDPYTAELLDEQSGERVSGGGSKGVMGGVFGNGQDNPNRTNSLYFDTGGASRFFYVAKASKRDRNEGLDELEVKRPDERTTTGMGSFEEKGVQPQRNFHPTVKPTALMEYLVKLVTPPNGTVLDPFTGSGSTGKAAILQGFNFIGIEMTEEYVPIIEGRLKHAEAKVAGAKENIETQPQGLF